MPESLTTVSTGEKIDYWPHWIFTQK